MQIGEVLVTWREDRGAFMLRYVDPATGKTASKSTGVKNKRAKGQAERMAEELRQKLAGGVVVDRGRTTWASFRDACENGYLSEMRPGSAKSVRGTLNTVERFLNPQRLTDLTPARLSAWVQQLRDGDLSEDTIAKHMRTLKAAITWARDNRGLTGAATRFPRITQVKKITTSTPAKGRPVTREELERMQDAALRYFGMDKAKAKPWQDYLEALWLSGLRLAESLVLSWNDDAPLRVEIVKRNGRPTPRLHIEGHVQKNGQTQKLPLATDFREWLLNIPQDDRTGPVFKLPGERLRQVARKERVGLIVSEIGKLARVVVSGGGESAKYASAHDLRRSFGDRWAERVMPAVLQKLMRHAHINTTLRYYVNKEAGDVEDACDAAMAPRRQKRAPARVA